MNMTDAKGKLHSFRKRTRYIDIIFNTVNLLENINVFNNIHNLQIISIQIIKLLAMYVDCNVRISYHIVELSSVMNKEEFKYRNYLCTINIYLRLLINIYLRHTSKILNKYTSFITFLHCQKQLRFYQIF